MPFSKQIPNLITCCNLLAGCTGLIFLLNDQLVAAAYMILLAAVFDFLDGTAARLLEAWSPLGKELDSLADVVSFGVLPGLIMYRIISQTAEFQEYSVQLATYLPFVALVLPVAAAIRLGRFNLDTRQSEHFLGLAVPASALFFAAFPIILSNHNLVGNVLVINTLKVIFDPILLTCFCLLFAILMLSEIPLFNIKFKNLGWKDNSYKYIFLFISLICIIFLNFAALIAIIPLYILMSVFFRGQFVKGD
ncbi:MAG: CDP-alcohol phosphatidyltransferase family protein [Bacteroidetes bacterium]|nr:CDP-alcohol phosphatidyltransferase family protein [Bacteroidota bacterium]